MSPRFSMVLGKWTLSSQSQIPKGPSRLSSATAAKANISHRHQCKQQGTTDMEVCTGRHPRGKMYCSVVAFPKLRRLSCDSHIYSISHFSIKIISDVSSKIS